METTHLLTDNRVLTIWQDENGDSPNDWGNEDIFLVYDHHQFNVEREGFEPRDIYTYLQQCDSCDTIDLRNDEYDKYWIFVVHAYIHSGVSLSLGNSSYPFNCRFDTSTTGFILVEKDITQEGKAPVLITEPEAKCYAEGLIETWNTYLSGKVYGFTIHHHIPCEHCGHIDKVQEDSCGGFYHTTDEELLYEMLSCCSYDLLDQTNTELQA